MSETQRHLDLSRTREQHQNSTDGPENYDILNEIGHGSSSVVYLATCKRGRLRNRQVALKKVSRNIGSNMSSTPDAPYSAPLHQSLHHPAIVSLFSTFSTSLAYYYILELCPRGTLCDYLRSRNPVGLEESELRMVLKTLVSALVYLRKELVVHRDLKAANILLTEDYQVKLADFGLAARLLTKTSTISTFCGSPNHVSPEILSRLPYSFSSDLWSLGCLIITCLCGTPPFEANTVPEIFGNVLRGEYTVPQKTSFELRDLVASLLQLDPVDRIPLHRILSHPFFNPAYPSQLLFPVNLLKKEDPVVHEPYKINDQMSEYHQKTVQTTAIRPNLSLPSRKPLGDIGNGDLRRLLRQEASSFQVRDNKPFGSGETNLSKRIVSDPLPRRITSLAAELSTLPRKGTGTSAIPELTADTSPSLSSACSHALLYPPETKAKNCAKKGSDSNYEADIVVRHRRNSASSSPGFDYRVAKAMKQDLIIPKDSEERADSAATPIGTMRPIAFTTSTLAPQTHKTVHGQVTILPSRAVLVDFREGERRRGHIGDEVMILHAERGQVDIYSAPHLSTPCCLAEPISIFAIQELPKKYWKQYNDAQRVVEQVKQKTPKLVLYETDTKCTLMSNGPIGDIELVYKTQVPPNSKHESRNGTSKNRKKVISMPYMRIRLSRQYQTLEIASYSSGSHPDTMQEGEWTKKTFTYREGGTIMSDVDRASLGAKEREGINMLMEFLHVCLGLETMTKKGSPVREIPAVRAGLSKIGTRDTEDDGPLRKFHVPDSKHKIPKNGKENYSYGVKPNSSTSTSTMGKALASISLAPRPAKLSSGTLSCPSVPSQTLHQDRGDFATSQHTASSGSTKAHSNIPSSMQEEPKLTNTYPAGIIQTRFIPLVGWCIRYGSRVSQGGRYRVMFIDGAVMDVDADEEHIEFTSQTGRSTRYAVRECATDNLMRERFEVFEEFVSLFDDSQHENIV
ncbi:hypothetical protein SERLA73DRAFT_77679 [Serpula lacrymans var. lacrymans S7.3]|uniref:Uncharacterized protein n=2 Tax=Serpula lacrymans var. lacrymans TaxID=341189 RepID=F8QBP3_SERL3|nr:uncharacterized protein SERLADRAFT_442577 [Serpula lacrymans var. lacrymans S7.9]EGN94254.1 hypothetical protein SERLA73DRAFT_77679 [Serpula lacrymans var. lacrymans S7.3]EGO19747.1 hypothetical protein SERLADRAFT_442577 [Serpula lacrymans var. lacrymans S7.9]